MEKGPGFSQLLWDFVDGKPKVNRFRSTRQVPAETALSRAMSKELCRPRLQVRRADHRLCLHAGDRHGQRPSGDVPPACRLRRASRAADAMPAEPPRPSRAARLAAHAVGAPARSARSLAARRRDRGHRPRARPRRALERADRGRAHLLGRPALPAGRDHRAPARAPRPPAAGSRCCCTTPPNT